MSIALTGCVTSVDSELPSTHLPEIIVASQITLVSSPSHPTAYLPTKPILPGEKVQLIGLDTNAAWLLILHDNQIGWMPSFYSQSNIGTFKPALVIDPLPDKCTNYLGTILKEEEEWTAAAGGSVVVYGAIYRPRVSSIIEKAALVAQIDGSGGRVAGGDYLHAWLTTSSSVVLFAYSFVDLQRGSVVKLRLDDPGADPLFFAAAFFSNDCQNELNTAGAPFTDQLPIGILRVPPPPPTPIAVASVPPTSVATATPIQVVSGPNEVSKPVNTPLPSPTVVAPRFFAERLTISAGECTTLRWNADGAQTVYLNGVSVPQTGARRVCPAETFAYVLTIREPDGRRNDWWLNVDVKRTVATLVPADVATPIVSEPAVTSTGEVVTDRDLLNEYVLTILRFQQIRKALLQTPSLPASDDLAAVASGEALEQVRVEADDLAWQRAYAELGLQQFDVTVAIVRDASKAAVLAREKYTLRQIGTKTGGGSMTQETAFDGKTVYLLVYQDERWKVERVRPLGRSGL